MLFAPKEKGQGLVEYALILVLIAVVVIVVLGALGTGVNGIFQQILDGLGA
jgi:pilus assembly protein Flp/PilA